MNKNFRKLKTESLKKFFSVLIPFVIIAMTLSCEDNANSLGADLIPDDDRIDIDYNTTLTFDGFLMNTGEFNTKNLSHYSIGNIKDPYFGEMVGAYAGQFVPPYYLTDLEFTNAFTDIIIDSANIVININYMYGSPVDEFEFSVYELTDSIPADADFDSNSNINDYYSAIETINDGMKVQGDSILIFPLKENFYSRLIDINDNFYVTGEDFIKEFKGIAIIPEEPVGVGGLYNFSVIESRITMYYLDDTIKEFHYSFYSGERFVEYSVDTTNAEINNYNDPETPADQISLWGLGGVQSKLVFSNYESVFNQDSSYSILNAELSVPVYKDDLFEICPPPERLYFYLDSNYTLIEDADNSAAFNGYYDEDNSEYNFNISKHLKNLINGDLSDPTLFIGMTDYSLYPNRVILQTGENIKLKVTYTKH
ncbi:MAG: DUF4270 domain-containing protein [Bacteroidales bacterium]|nr:DUF4270 domain-containing protein [Bacteroidales bacterium]